MGLICLLTHNFKARYSEKIPPGLTFRGSTEEIIKQMQTAKIQVYEGDVCTDCGAVVNKPTKSLQDMMG